MSDNVWASFLSIQLPHWLITRQKLLQSESYSTDDQKMRLVFHCAQSNVEHGGAPLAAAVFLADGQLISVGVDAPGIGGHEMTNALILASNILSSEYLRGHQNWEMFSLAPPCLICQGNIFSERPKRFVCSVSHQELRSSLHLPNTPFPPDDWQQVLEQRSIIVKTGFRNAQALEILRAFART